MRAPSLSRFLSRRAARASAAQEESRTRPRHRLPDNGGRAFERERRLLLERAERRLDEHEDLRRGVEREGIESRRKGAESDDDRGAPGGDGGERVGERARP